jgi:hypothetical protein
MNRLSERDTINNINIMELTNELEKLRTYFLESSVEKYKEQYLLLKDKFTSELEIKQIDECIDAVMHESKIERDRAMEEIRLRCHLILNKEIIPFSYIAKNYFKKSKEWLYQRLNENIVNGKPARFSESEIKTFNFALQDISKKINQKCP